MSNPVQEFEDALIVDRVTTRFAMEHDSPEALKKYFREHPGADKSNHRVKKQEGAGKSPRSKEPDSSLADAEAARSKTRSEASSKEFDELKSLQKKVEDASDSAKKKFDRAYGKLLEHGRAAQKAAEKLLKKYEDLGEGLEDEAKSQSEATIKMLKSKLGDWKLADMDHQRIADGTAHKMVLQAEQTFGYAQDLEKWVRAVSSTLKGDYDIER